MKKEQKKIIKKLSKIQTNKKKTFKNKLKNNFLTKKRQLVKTKQLFRPDEKKTDFQPNISENYQLNIDKAVVNIKISKTEEGLTYSLFIPEIEKGTEALLDDIRKDLITITSISIGEMADKKAVEKIKNRFITDAHNLLRKKVPDIQIETQDFLIGMLMQEMLGLGKIEFLINDPQLEEIVITSSKEPIRIYHKKYGWLKTNIIPKSEDEIVNYSNIIARRVGRQINVLEPLLDAHVVTGDRANAVLYPISTKGNTITIRKFARDPFTIAHLIENKTVSIEIASLLWLAIEYEMNVLISGGTASGKTVFLNACMPFIPPNHRVISMEDTRELMLPEFLYWCPLVTRTANPEGKGEVSMLDLLVNSLRMRPDRIVLGEIRRQKEAEVLFEAMHTGHSVYATVHADTANETIRRLTNPPINVPPNMLGNVNLNVVMFRDRKRGLRRTSQVAEFMPGKEKITANILHRWIPETDQFVIHNTSLSLFDELGRHTGMSEKEIQENLDKKKKILEWTIKNKLNDLKTIGKIMNLYYMNKEKLYDIIKNNSIDKLKEPKKIVPQKIKLEPKLTPKPEIKNEPFKKVVKPEEEIRKEKFEIPMIKKEIKPLSQLKIKELPQQPTFKAEKKLIPPLESEYLKRNLYQQQLQKPKTQQTPQKPRIREEYKRIPEKIQPKNSHPSNEMDKMREEIMKIEGELKNSKLRIRKKYQKGGF
ncbi:MAG: Flp pilus assembly complex ATPase component TadA [Nanoarchaeota archaeon]|nr:Flp pilus assembly complex ATPase component TadA [Nanoarchaeota archaeon]MBU1027472.1 Flp pilus assembly complex ATPase component TadA [Nanoarchaeota archaeon]